MNEEIHKLFRTPTIRPCRAKDPATCRYHGRIKILLGQLDSAAERLDYNEFFELKKEIEAIMDAEDKAAREAQEKATLNYVDKFNSIVGEEFIFHQEIGFPRGIKLPDAGTLELLYSPHAINAANDDRLGRILLPKTINLSEAQLVEIEVKRFQHNGKTITVPSKYLLRVPHDARNDLLVALMPSKPLSLVKTVWLNENSDKHSTLDRRKYHPPQILSL